MNKIINGSYQKKHKSIKYRNLRKDLLLMSMFNLNYAGKCSVWIQKHFNNYQVVCQGLHIIDQELYTFSPNFYKRYTYDSLYTAILRFNKILALLSQDIDWYSPELFDTNKVYDEVTIE